ncbi:TauD/TfdA family dioxygenase [Nocardia sp. CDC153]|uniref:TauD/TfdA family dioxygenase n=1 Tax=Nocardia sp. CDC153 TaxID=3112167 RepID=UPI002DBCB67D|nr:TauD/TfdA family dioxygenase [Nocardia sp. CDC153]MEC3952773.1 TauD/TfdA family dioxygenase [Nocardia sp. CDC153]
MTTGHAEFLSAELPSGRVAHFHWVWLRDSCPCEECRNIHAKQKYFDSATIPADITASAVRQTADRVEIIWPDGHRSDYPMRWLAEREAQRLARPPAPDGRIPWTSPAAVADHRFAYRDIMADDSMLVAALDRLFRHGILVIDGQTDADSDALCARLAGFVDRSYFGEYFDLETKPDDTTDSISFSTRQLPMHTDIPYYTVPPDYQFLYGLDINAAATAATDGRTRFADGLAAAHRLREADPEAFRVLSTIPVTYRAEYRAAEKIYENETTIIRTDHNGEVVGLVNNPTKMYFDTVPFESTIPLYRAYATFKGLLGDEVCYFHSWHPGDMIVFDNRRIFHGRGEFGASGIVRTLRGGYFSEIELAARARFVAERIS